jgi:signal transduction histidine kinase
MKLIYKTNAYAAIVLGIVFILFAFQLKDLYSGRDARVDLIRVVGMALVALAIVTLTVVSSAGSHFMALARIPFGLAFYLIAPMNVFAFTRTGLTWTILSADFLLILAFCYLPHRYAFRSGSRWAPADQKREILADWQEEIRETASRQERTRLAEELHDSIKQQLFSIQANLAAAEARWESDQPSVQEAIAHARSSAREAMAETTAMLDQLQAAPLESVGLVEALRRQSEALAFRTGAKVETRFADVPASLPQKTQTALFRIAQEALSNIARHARAKNVRLELGEDPEDRSKLLIQIQDDGVGFPNENLNQGMGFSNMRSRAKRIGGTLSIDGSLGPGSMVSLRLDPMFESDQDRARHKNIFLTSLGLGLLFLLAAWDKKGNDTVPFVSSCIWAAVLIAAAGYSGWRYLQLKHRELRRHA